MQLSCLNALAGGISTDGQGNITADGVRVPGGPMGSFPAPMMMNPTAIDAGVQSQLFPTGDSNTTGTLGPSNPAAPAPVAVSTGGSMAPSTSQVVTSTPGASIGASSVSSITAVAGAAAPDTCASLAAQIPALQASGYSNAQILQSLQTTLGAAGEASLMTCPAVQALAAPAGSSSGGSSTSTSGCFNPLAQWFTSDTCISTSIPIGIFEAAIAAGLLLWAFSAGGKR
jgi:hypothetical protein